MNLITDPLPLNEIVYEFVKFLPLLPALSSEDVPEAMSMSFTSEILARVYFLKQVYRILPENWITDYFTRLTDTKDLDIWIKLSPIDTTLTDVANSAFVKLFTRADNSLGILSTRSTRLIRE